ncbi:DDE-type integrase/transposase/recombinase [Candidatus Nitrosocosmicus agrestis]|jgi:putative transposase|uniref:DDE-type integrase/transposase/recombinase n=1 Tax=Candidatus Nitrosocosmicus agrestis TaxID=2563600 RepID=UPI0018A82763|nr:DDE-type integrase/transposase/recombinase [Candidatus Nitrosocosmicus sp. SS]MDR4489473.1 DDE-type integrase/transposase/recombinase [Candidatus Nitrosocosmicus sp.]
MEDIVFAVNLYFDGLSLRKTSKALSRFVSRSHTTAIRDWIEKYKPQRLLSKSKKIAEFIVDETLIKVGSEYVWLWIAIEPETRQILAVTVSRERNMLITERFLSGLIKDYGKHPVSTDGGTWYPQGCEFLKLKHHIHSSLEKSLIERTIQYVKDRTESFDDYFPCRKQNCKLEHIKQWITVFAWHHNNNIRD